MSRESKGAGPNESDLRPFSVVSRLRHYDAAAPRSRRRLETRHTRRDDLIGGFATHFAQLLERFGKSLLAASP